MNFQFQRLSPVLVRRSGWYQPEGAWTHAHWCPACNAMHDFAVEQPFVSNGAQWTFDGKVDEPSFSPSMNIRIGPFRDGKFSICHYFLRAGQLIYQSDCTHAMKGKTTSLPLIPDGIMNAREVI